MYRRFPHVSSHFLQGAATLTAHGFIRECYSSGLSVRSIISEAHATCESVVNKNKGTSTSGYTVRKLTTCMMGVVIDYCRRAVDTNHRVIWPVYGSDGYDPQCMTNGKLRLLGFKEWDIARRYGTIFNLKDLIQLSSTSTKAQWTKLLGDPASEQKTASQIDAVWFAKLRHYEGPGQRPITDQTSDLDSVMQPQTLTEWHSIKHEPHTVELLTGEIEDLLKLKRRVQFLLSRCHESFDVSIVRTPFSFRHLFQRCRDTVEPLELGDLHPLNYREFAVDLWKKLVSYQMVVETNLTFKSLFFDWMSTRSLMLHWKFGLKHILWLCREIVSLLSRAVIQPGESVGVNATQNLGEPFSVSSWCHS
jgi:hypothetical protein